MGTASRLHGTPGWWAAALASSLVGGLGHAGTPAAPLPEGTEGPERRAVIFEPCSELYAPSPALGAFERVAAERSFALERQEPHGDVQAWLALLARPPGALFLHTVCNREVLAIACFEHPQARDLALQALEAEPPTRGLPLQPWHYQTEDREIFLIGYELAALAEQLRGSGTLMYFHREGDPRAVVEAPGLQVSREQENPQAPINHFAAAKRFFRQRLPGVLEPEALGSDDGAAGGEAGEGSAAAPPPEPKVALELWPEAATVVLPVGEIWLTARNTGSVPLSRLGFETVAAPPRLELRALGRLPERLEPGEEVDIPLGVELQRQLPHGAHRIPFAIHATLPDGRAYDELGCIDVVVEHPPRITAPSSVEFAREEGVEILARDPDLRPVHLEALLPPGIELVYGGHGTAHLVFSRDEIPGAPRTTVTLLAWSGEDWVTARPTQHEIEILGGDLPPPAWITYGAYAGLGLFSALVWLRERLLGRRLA